MITHDAYGGHSDLWSYIDGLREDLSRAEERIGELAQIVSVNGETLDSVRNRVYALEQDSPQARQLRDQADQAGADLAMSGYDRHGHDCGCSYCYYDPEEEGR